MATTHTVGRFAIVILLVSAALSVSTSQALAAGDGSSIPYKVSMTRENPSSPLRKSTIMAHVKQLYPGRILSIMEDKTRGDDCHIVKLMGKDGEFRIIHVACTS